MTLSINGLFAILSINDNQRYRTVIMQCRVVFIVRLNVVMLGVVMLIVVAPLVYGHWTKFKFKQTWIKWVLDAQHNDIQHNDTWHNDTQYNNKWNSTFSIMTLSKMVERCYAVQFMLTVVYTECHKLALYDECHYTERRGANKRIQIKVKKSISQFLTTVRS